MTEEEDSITQPEKKSGLPGCLKILIAIIVIAMLLVFLVLGMCFFPFKR